MISVDELESTYPRRPADVIRALRDSPGVGEYLAKFQDWVRQSWVLDPEEAEETTIAGWLESWHQYLEILPEARENNEDYE